VAEDLLHDAFVIILTSIDQLKQADKLEAWMTSIVRNVGSHYQRYVKKEQLALRQMTKDERPSEEEIPVPDYDQIQALISQLPQGYRQVFRLSVFEGLTHKEIGQLLNVTPNTSSSQLYNAKRMLRLLIRKSWVLMLLLLAIPAVVWWYLRKQTSMDGQTPVVGKAVSQPHIPTSAEKSGQPPVHTQVASSTSSTSTPKSKAMEIKGEALPSASHSVEVAVLSDSVPGLTADSIAIPPAETAQTKKEEPQGDTITYPLTPWQPVEDQMAYQPAKTSRQWNVSLAYNGQMGHGKDFMGATTIGNIFSEEAAFVKSSCQFSNWKDYYNYLKTNSSIQDAPEVHSLMGIALRNSDVNNGAIEARYEHQLPITLQLMLSRKISGKASIETGLSYTLLNSTITTGSANANIQERQKIRYLGIPIRLGWLWYKNTRFSLYTSTGPMLELPLHSTVGVRHFINGSNTFQKEASPNVPVQWSVSLGLGAQYNVTPYLGIYLEPGVQYFLNSGSSIKTYRTEHPLEFTLPIGFRFHW